jgi:hypothetical protein
MGKAIKLHHWRFYLIRKEGELLGRGASRKECHRHGDREIMTPSGKSGLSLSEGPGLDATPLVIDRLFAS